MTRSAISQNLSKLESELGVQLFTRFPQGLIPTSTGHALAAIEKDFINLMTHYAKKEWDNGMSYKQD